jgi:hypothetical protein
MSLASLSKFNKNNKKKAYINFQFQEFITHFFNQTIKNSIFWDVTPCSLSKVNCLLPASLLISCLVYFSALKTEVTWSSEMSVDFQRATWHYTPEDRTLHNHCSENLESYTKPCTYHLASAITKKKLIQRLSDIKLLNHVVTWTNTESKGSLSNKSDRCLCTAKWQYWWVGVAVNEFQNWSPPQKWEMSKHSNVMLHMRLPTTVLNKGMLTSIVLHQCQMHTQCTVPDLFMSLQAQEYKNVGPGIYCALLKGIH